MISFPEEGDPYYNIIKMFLITYFYANKSYIYGSHIHDTKSVWQRGSLWDSAWTCRNVY